jgi:hypothetical protein
MKYTERFKTVQSDEIAKYCKYRESTIQVGVNSGYYISGEHGGWEYAEGIFAFDRCVCSTGDFFKINDEMYFSCSGMSNAVLDYMFEPLVTDGKTYVVKKKKDANVINYVCKAVTHLRAGHTFGGYKRYTLCFDIPNGRSLCLKDAASLFSEFFKPQFDLREELKNFNDAQ